MKKLYYVFFNSNDFTQSFYFSLENKLHSICRIFEEYKKHYYVTLEYGFYCVEDCDFVRFNNDFVSNPSTLNSDCVTLSHSGLTVLNKKYITHPLCTMYNQSRF